MLLKNKRTGNVYAYSPVLANDPEFELFEETHTYDAAKGIRLAAKDGGIGDDICALYVACGLANAGYKTFLHVRKLRWLEVVQHPNLTIVEGFKQPVVDARVPYPQECSEAYAGKYQSRVQAYMHTVAAAYGIKPVQPARPETVNIPPRKISEDYVVLAPMSSKTGRDWSLPSWRELAKRQILAGRKVVVVGAGTQEFVLRKAFEDIDVEMMIGKSPMEVITAVAHAVQTIGNDSGIAHLGGLLSVDTTALIAQFQPEYTFECAPTIRGVIPGKDCVGCCAAPESKFQPACLTACAALAELTVDDVMTAIDAPKAKPTKKRAKKNADSPRAD